MGQNTAELMQEQANAPPAPQEKQQFTRTSTFYAGRLIGDGTLLDCEILNISAGGAKIRVAGTAPAKGERHKLRIDRIGEFRASVAWVDGDLVGLAFQEDPRRVAMIIQNDLDEVVNPRDRRRFVRCSVLWSGVLHSGRGQADCIIVNISASGAKVRLLQPFRNEAPVRLKIHRFGEYACDVMWQTDEAIGVRFVDDPRKIAEVIGEILPRLKILPQDA
jgi:hypothetical protein